MGIVADSRAVVGTKPEVAVCLVMPLQQSSTECRLKAESLEQMAITVCYRLDRERFAAEALIWRDKEKFALTRETGLLG